VLYKGFVSWDCGILLVSMTHSSDIGDGYDWGRLNLRSVTEESRLDDFLHTAELAGTEFTAGRSWQECANLLSHSQTI